jgi:hypothetical protein
MARQARMNRRDEEHGSGFDFAYVDVRLFSRGSDGSDPPAKRLRYSDSYEGPFGFDQQLL